MKKKPKQLTGLFARQRGRCFYCDEPMTLNGPQTDRKRATRDHVIPSRWRVPHPAGTAGPPAVAACARCNEERGHLPAHEYIAVWGMRLKEARVM